jgi:PAS domain S-box-containing protein
VQNEAICHELAGRFYLSKAIETSARAYIMLAHEGYRRWGAAAKVRSLEAGYPDWFREQTAFKEPGEAQSTPTPSSSSTGTEALDMMSVIKASQAISGEIHLDRLLDRLMKIVMENAGARRGLLILEQEGRLYRVAEGTADGEAVVLQSLPVDGSEELAESVVHYTARTQKAVVLDDAANEGLFIHDPYIMARAAKSILCTPIIRQGELSGLLYLENDLTSHAFTPARVGVLESLSAQIAISLDNARLYEESRRAQESLEESELKFRTLAETMRAAVVIFRGEEFLYVNPAAETISGYTNEEFLKMDFSSIIHPDYLTLVQEREFARWHGFPVPAQYEFKIVTKNGGERWVMGSAGLIEFDGEPAAIGALLDITDYKDAEEERRLLHEENVRHYQERIEEEKRHQREKENILMDIHDGIGGLATNIGLLAEVAQKASSPVDLNRTLSRISGLAREGMAEIRNLMYSLDSRDLSWHTLIAELKNLGSKTVEPHGIVFEMTTDVKDDTTQPNSLLCLHLFRIYRETLTNIIKHARAGKVTVGLLVMRDSLVVTVQDDGQGFDTTASAGKGRGMNNMAVRAAEMGGSVTITGGKGTCITLRIPL